uniref:Uncharacterized protein n=1 Tax=Arundo donax TaxID=35708 RepID=A0A0A9FAR0_ARUDO
MFWFGCPSLVQYIAKSHGSKIVHSRKYNFGTATTLFGLLNAGTLGGGLLCSLLSRISEMIAWVCYYEFSCSFDVNGNC